MRSAFEASGEIRSVDLLAAFVVLWRERGSGALSFRRPDAHAAFEIAAGEVVGVSSSEPRFETAAILVRAGKLDPGAIARVVVPEGGDPGAVALQAGLVTRKDWRWGQKIRAVEVLSDLLGWIEGHYELDAGALAERGEFPLPIPRLLLELFLRSRDRSLIEHTLGPSDVPLVRVDNFDGEFEGFGLTSDAGTVVAMIDGKATAEEISEKAPADEFAVLKLLAALTTLGLVHSTDAVPAAHLEPLALASAEAETEPQEGGEVEPETQEREGVTEAEPVAQAEPIEAQREEPAAAEPPPALPASTAAEPAPEQLPAPPPPATRGVGRLLAGLLILLAAAVGGLLLLRSHGGRGAGEQPVPPPPTPTRESLVFPPAETAPPLPGRRQTPSPVPSRIESPVPPTLRPAAAAPSPIPPTRVPSSPVPPTRRLTAAATPIPTHRPTATTTPFPTRRPTVTATPIPARRPTAAATPIPTRRPMPPAAAPTRLAATARPLAAPTPAFDAAPSGSREEWIRRAERDRARYGAGRGSRYTIQLELACELPTLSDAWKRDQPAGTMWLVTTPYRGRVCFRVLWGHFATKAQAVRAKVTIPGFFVTPDNRPAVVSVR